MKSCKSFEYLDVQGRLTVFGSTKHQDGRFCWGVYQLLQGTSEYGSLALAAKRLGMAYSKAWRIMRECEKQLGFNLIKRDGARGSYITPEGNKMLNAYSLVDKEIDEYANRRFKELME